MKWRTEKQQKLIKQNADSLLKKQISTTDKPLADPIKEEREKTQIRNKNKETTKDMTKFYKSKVTHFAQVKQKI